MGNRDIFKTIRQGFRKSHKYDMFKNSFSFTYKGEEKIPSGIGMCATILIFMVAFVYFLMFTIRMFQK